MPTPEGKFKTGLIKDLESMFPDCVILHQDAQLQQGIPDLLILIGPRWAALELKKARNAERQPNQPWWVERLDNMSFAAFVSPENKEAVLDDLQNAFGARRPTRVSFRK